VYVRAIESGQLSAAVGANEEISILAGVRCVRAKSAHPVSLTT
jgi:hypothetical protein